MRKVGLDFAANINSLVRLNHAARQGNQEHLCPTVVVLAGTLAATPQIAMIMNARYHREGLKCWMLPQGAIQRYETAEEAAERILREETGLYETTVVGYIGHAVRKKRVRLCEQWGEADGRLMIFMHLQLIGSLRLKHGPSVAGCLLADTDEYKRRIQTASEGKRVLTDAAVTKSRVFWSRSTVSVPTPVATSVTTTHA